ncbi:MAG TPA: glycosyltransferase family 2 protein [Candidatus Kapabacteria bacterium]|nr:glycosyltransferase family 2 protein [Candidatus Kapabacteria bacterium]
MNKILIIVPAYNEEANIKQTISALSAIDNDVDILVVNDGSTDATSHIVSALPNVNLINLKINLGIGGAVQTGFKYAKKYNYDIAIQFDGDGQHNANEIEKLLHALTEYKADMVIGSRFINKQGFQSTLSRRVGIFVFELLNAAISGQRVSDNTSGFRAYSKRAIEYLAVSYPQDYPEPELVIIMAKKGFRIIEVPVIMNKREGGKSSINGLKSIYYMIKVILSILITSMRKF